MPLCRLSSVWGQGQWMYKPINSVSHELEPAECKQGKCCERGPHTRVLMLREISQSEKGKYHMTSLTGGI